MRIVRKDIPTIANAVWLGPWSMIVIGRYFDRLSPLEQAATLAHERGHLAKGHTRARIVWLAKCRWLHSSFATFTRAQEFEADDYAVARGHAAGLIKLLARAYEVDPSPHYPSPQERIARIRQRSKPCLTP